MATAVRLPAAQTLTPRTGHRQHLRPAAPASSGTRQAAAWRPCLSVRAVASRPSSNPTPTRSPPPLRTWPNVQVPARMEPAVKCEAASATTADSGDETEGFGKRAYLAFLIFMWYGFSVFFGVFNKQVLNVFPHPTTLTLLNLLVGSALACTAWATGLQKRPEVTKDMLIRIAPLAVVHTVGNLLTNISLGKVAVSFTHTIKSCEPFFSVLFSAIFLGDIPSVALVLSLLPIVAGISLASFTEPSFHWLGLISAMGANITFTSRNVFSKKVMGNMKDKLDNINLFSIITIMSVFMCLPITMAMDGFLLTPDSLSSGPLSNVWDKALMAGLCFHGYQQVSYMVLSKVAPVTHSVAKCAKSVVVITASLLFFRNPITPLNAFGTALALVGVFLYSSVKTKEKAAKAAAAAAAEPKTA